MFRDTRYACSIRSDVGCADLREGNKPSAWWFYLHPCRVHAGCGDDSFWHTFEYARECTVGDCSSNDTDLDGALDCALDNALDDTCFLSYDSDALYCAIDDTDTNP